jgi:hypothetical protein
LTLEVNVEPRPRRVRGSRLFPATGRSHFLRRCARADWTGALL